jgi:flagellar hook protein FlgE
MSFDIALSGINAINTELDTISNNIANVNTTGFKSSRSNFAAMYAGLQPTGTQVTSTSQSIDLGGDAESTGDDMDAAISGAGFFITKDAAGRELYTRAGVFSQNSDGYIVDSFGNNVQGYAAVKGTSALGAMGNLQVPTGQIAAAPSTALTYVANLSADWTPPATATFDPTDATSYNSSTVSVVYDSLGVQHSLTQYFVNTGTDADTVYYTLDGTTLPTTTALTFSTGGTLTLPAAAVPVALGTPTGAAALAVNINYAGTTQYSGNATTTTNAANGYASGSLTGVVLSADGSVEAEYSNGQTQSVGTLALATFPDDGGLVPVSDTAWTASTASGTPLFYTPGTGMAGTLTIGSVEQSNVNLTSQLVNLMSAQNNYQANSKVLQTESQMLQTLMQAL